MNPRRPQPGAKRVTTHRSRQSTGGSQRVELTVPAEHVPLLRAVAKLLRSPEASNDDVAALHDLVGPEQRPARTGDELLAFFRSSPFVGEDIDLVRDRSSGRPIDLS